MKAVLAESGDHYVVDKPSTSPHLTSYPHGMKNMWICAVGDHQFVEYFPYEFACQFMRNY